MSEHSHANQHDAARMLLYNGAYFQNITTGNHWMFVASICAHIGYLLSSAVHSTPLYSLSQK